MLRLCVSVCAGVSATQRPGKASEVVNWCLPLAPLEFLAEDFKVVHMGRLDDFDVGTGFAQSHDIFAVRGDADLAIDGQVSGFVLALDDNFDGGRFRQASADHRFWGPRFFVACTAQSLS
jgi:hypothetical protein